jgi:hypothetical protein
MLLPSAEGNKQGVDEMLNHFRKEGAWFAAKRYGYGAGFPITWQGWTLLGAYTVAVLGIGLLSEQEEAVPRAAAFAMILVITGYFLLICRNRTEGGWRWRWGE